MSRHRRAGAAALLAAVCVLGSMVVVVSQASATPDVFPQMTTGAFPPSAQNEFDSQISSLSCASASSCEGVGQYQESTVEGSGTGIQGTGFVDADSSGTWSAATQVATPAAVPGTALANTPVTDVVPILSSISCTSTGNCTAVGEANGNGIYEAIAAGEADGIWQTPTVVLTPFEDTQYSSLASVSCTSSGTCTAVGTYQASASTPDVPFSAVQTSGSWATGVGIQLPGDATTDTSAIGESVSCTSAGDCVAVGYYNSEAEDFVATSSGGTFAQASSVTQPSGATDATFGDVWCSDTSDCVAVGSYDTSGGVTHGMAATESGGTWGTAASTDDDTTSTQLDDVSCSDTSDCTAFGVIEEGTGNEAAEFTESGGTWASAVIGPTDVWEMGIAAACPTSTCQLGFNRTFGSYQAASADTFSGPSFGSAAQLAMPANLHLSVTGLLLSTSCPSSSTCDVLGAYVNQTNQYQAYDITYVDGAIAAVTPLAITEPNSAGVNYVGSISCGEVGDCVAYFEGQGYGQSLDVESNGTWGTPTSLPETEQLASVSCIGASWCAAVGTNTEAVLIDDEYYQEGTSTIYSDGSWSTQQLVPNSYSLFGISCWAVGSCEAVGEGINTSDDNYLQEIGVELSSSTWQSTNFVQAPGAPSPTAWIGSLNAISCAPDGSCLAVGAYEYQYVLPVTATVVQGQWDQSEPADLPPNTESNQDGIFSSVSCPDDNDCTAVGYYVDTSGQFQAMQATTDVNSAEIPVEAIESPTEGATPTTEVITLANAVACPNAEDCLVVGDYNTVVDNQFVLEPAVSIAGSAPSSPTGVEALAGNRTLTIKWTAASASAWDGATGYTAYAGSKSCTTTGATSCKITGLTNNKSYTVLVLAANAFGGGSASSTVIGVPTSGKPKGAPGPVTELKASGCAKCVLLTWTAPKNVGTGIAYYMACGSGTSPGCHRETKPTAKISTKVSEKFTVTVYAKDGEHSKPISVTGKPKT
jgi:hypothetical protein